MAFWDRDEWSVVVLLVALEDVGEAREGVFLRHFSKKRFYVQCDPVGKKVIFEGYVVDFCNVRLDVETIVKGERAHGGKF